MQEKRFRGISVSLLCFVISTVFLLLCLSLFIFTARLITPKAVETTPIEYTLFFTAIPKKTAEGIMRGDAAVDAVRKGSLGRISLVEVTPHKREVADGECLRILEDPSLCDMRLTLRASAQTDGRTVAGVSLYIGTKLNIRLPAYTGSGICIKIKEVSV